MTVGFALRGSIAVGATSVVAKTFVFGSFTIPPSARVACIVGETIVTSPIWSSVTGVPVSVVVRSIFRASVAHLMSCRTRVGCAVRAPVVLPGFPIECMSRHPISTSTSTTTTPFVAFLVSLVDMVQMRDGPFGIRGRGDVPSHWHIRWDQRSRFGGSIVRI